MPDGSAGLQTSSSWELCESVLLTKLTYKLFHQRDNVIWLDVMCVSLFFFFILSSIRPPSSWVFFFFFLWKTQWRGVGGQFAKRLRRQRKLISVKNVHLHFSAPWRKLPRRRKVSQYEDLPAEHLKTRWWITDHLSLSCRDHLMHRVGDVWRVSQEDSSAPSGGREYDGSKGGRKRFIPAFLFPFLNQLSTLIFDLKCSPALSKCWQRSHFLIQTTMFLWTLTTYSVHEM